MARLPLLLVILGLTALRPGVAAAQDRAPRVGVMGQYTFASLNWSPDQDTYRTKHWGGGVTFEVPLSDGASIEARGLFTRRGGDTEAPRDARTFARITVTSLTVPVLFKLGKATGMYIAGGPELSLRLRSKYEITGPGGLDESGDLDDVVPRLDIGLTFGAGFAAKNAFVEVMWSRGRKSSEDLDDARPRFHGDESFTMRAWTIGAGVRF